MLTIKSRFFGALVVALLLPSSGWCRVIISEVLFDAAGVDTGNQIVELLNDSDAAVEMGDDPYWLHLAPSSWRFPVGTSLPAHAIVRVHINRSGVNTATDFYTGISGMRNLTREDSVALFRRNLFGDPEQILHFLQWGRAGQAGEEVAMSAGLWTTGDFIDVGGLRAGSSLAYDGDGFDSSDWCIDGAPTLGVENDACEPSIAMSPVILHEIGTHYPLTNQAHTAVELLNVGDTLEDLGGAMFVLGDEHTYQFAAGTLLAPGELLVLHVGIDGVDGEFDVYSGTGTFRALRSADAVALLGGSDLSDHTLIIDFLQWGASGSPLEALAATAGRWNAGEFVASGDLRPIGSLASLPQAEPIGPERWWIDNTPTIGLDNSAPTPMSILINEALIDPVGDETGRQEVEIFNATPVEADLGGYTLAFESSAAPETFWSFSFPSSTRLASGDYLVVRVNRSGFNSSNVIHSGPLHEIDPAGGAMALFATSDRANPNNLVDYFAWGDGGSASLESDAAMFGLWVPSSRIMVDQVRDDSSIAYLGEGESAEAYRIDRSPSIGAVNTEAPAQSEFRRGDCNDDGGLDLSDALFLFNSLFLGGPSSLCEDACDGNNDDIRDVSDPVFLLNLLFLGGPELAEPGFSCGLETEVDTLSCNSYLHCD